MDMLVNARNGTRSEHSLEFLSNSMGTLDKYEIKGRYLVMNNAAIHKAHKVQSLIEIRGYDATYFCSSFLHPTKLFWSKIQR